MGDLVMGDLVMGDLVMGDLVMGDLDSLYVIDNHLIKKNNDQ
jgi:hypothetical protein